jgi:hypothetical protein
MILQRKGYVGARASVALRQTGLELTTERPGDPAVDLTAGAIDRNHPSATQLVVARVCELEQVLDQPLGLAFDREELLVAQAADLLGQTVHVQSHVEPERLEAPQLAGLLPSPGIEVVFVQVGHDGRRGTAAWKRDRLLHPSPGKVEACRRTAGLRAKDQPPPPAA